MAINKIEMTIIKNAISNLAAICAGDEDVIIDKLTGYLWGEEEAGKIRNKV